METTSGDFVSEISSQRGKTLIVFKNYKFKEHNRKMASGETKWRCIKDKCKAFIHTLGEPRSRVITSLNENHSHEPEQENVLQRKIISSSIKRKAESDIVEKPSKIIRKELGKQDTNSMNLTTRDIYCIRKNIYYARRKFLPALPKSTLEVHDALQKMQPKTNRQEDFLLLNDSLNNVVIFSCIANLKFLSDSKILYMDGTFSYCTKYFKQLFTIHGFLNGHYIPLVFCLLKDKTQKSYEFCLSKVAELCKNVDVNLSPLEIVVDFEMSIHNAINSIWENIKISGCRFHLTQAWYRQIQKLGLTQQYRDKNSEVGKWLHYCFGLLFLNHEEVEDFYFFELYELKPQNDQLDKFSDYLLETYLTNESKFPPHIWANASADLNKTTNACESFHSHFNNSMYQTHPSIFPFVDELINVQTETYIKCNSINAPHRFKNIATKKKHDFIANKIRAYKSKTLSTLEYVKIVSYYYAHNNNI